MKKVLLLIFVVLIAALVWMIVTKQKDNNKVVIHPFNLVTLNSDTVKFTATNFPHKLIFNFYSSECSICMKEVSDLVTFSKKYKTRVIFVTADSKELQQKFKTDLEAQGLLQNADLMFARVSLADADALLGDLTTPQTIVFDDGLEVKSVKKGLVSINYLRKSFE